MGVKIKECVIPKRRWLGWTAVGDIAWVNNYIHENTIDGILHALLRLNDAGTKSPVFNIGVRKL